MHTQLDPRHRLALSLARKLESLLVDSYQPDGHPRARVAKALAHSLVDELASLEPARVA